MALRGVEEASTVKATTSCFERFTHCVRELEGAQNTHIKNRHADFKLWADSVGAAAQGQASLDWRFHDRPDDIFLVQGLLEMLEGFLKDCAAASEDEKAVEEVLRKIDSIMHDLISVGVAIRRSGRKSRLHKADSSFGRDREKYLDLRIHLATVVASRPSEGPRTLSESDSFANMELSPIQNRLIEANLRRRHRFMEAQRHSNLLKSPTFGVFERPSRQQITKILADIGANSSSEHSEIQPDEPELEQLLPATATSTETMTISRTIASAPETGFKGLQHNDHASSTATRITAITAAARYPRAKTSETNQFSFKCPCCCQAIPAEESEDNQFKKHLANDICPYTCIFDNCPTPYKLFVTQKEWKEHFMHAHPPKFQCPYCNNVPLSSLAGIMSHIQLDHPGIADDELADALTGSPIHVMGITKCPLCDSEDSPDSPELIEHVLEHIHDFSLRSLPWPKDPVPHLNKAVGTFNIAAQNVNAIIQWVHKSSPENECQLQLCDMDINQSTEEEAAYNESQANYFDVNDYFLEESSDGRFGSQSAQSYFSRSESRQPGDSGDSLQTASHEGPEYLDESATVTSAEDFETRLSYAESSSVQHQELLFDSSNIAEAEQTKDLLRASIVRQVLSKPKKKESDVLSTLSKTFKLRRSAQAAQSFEDPIYNPLEIRFNEHFYQVQVVLRDVEMYIRETTKATSGIVQFREIASCFEGCIDIVQSNYPEIAETWHQLCVNIQDITNNNLEEHKKRVRKDVIDPMLTVLKLFDGPQKVIDVRNKLLPDYNRFAEMPDKKPSEKGMKFMMLNEALKDELPKFFHLVRTLMLACLEVFVAIQQEWYLTILHKLSPLVDDIPHDFLDVVSHWSAKFGTVNARIESLALFNGAPMLPIPQPRPIDHDLSSLSVDNNAINIEAVVRI